MKRQAVASSNVKSIGLEAETLEIEFANGNVYSYTGASAAEHHEQLLKAESVGSYFAKHVRPDRRLEVRKL